MSEDNTPGGRKELSVEMSQIEAETLAEDEGLRVLDAMLSNVLIGVRSCKRTSDNGLFNKFNLKKFCDNMDYIKDKAIKMLSETE